MVARCALRLRNFSHPDVVARLDRANQYSRAGSVQPRCLWNTGSPAFAGDDTEFCNLRCPKRVSSFSRRVLRPSFATTLPSEDRGRREDRVFCAPADSYATKKAYELVTTGTPKQSGLPCAMDLTALFALSPVSMTF